MDRHWHGTTDAILDLATGGSRHVCTDPTCQPVRDEQTIRIPDYGDLPPSATSSPPPR